MKRLITLLATVLASAWAFPSVVPPEAHYPPSIPHLDPRATNVNPNLTSYLGVFFLGDKPSIYLYLSNGQNAFSMKALNGGKPVITPTLGTVGVRDPSIVAGGGAEKGKKWYIIGTDLNIAKTTWDASQRKGSLSIFVWESDDLVTWGKERLVKVEGDNGGMVWAPDAVWDEAKGQYLAHWASKTYASSDPSHKGSPSATVIRYAYTTDFKTFTSPQTFVSASPTSIIDLCLLPLPSTSTSSSWARFLKNESSSAKTVYMETSTTGLFGTWTRPGGKESYIEKGVEGPYAWLDNEVEGKVNLLLDYYGGDGYAGFSASLGGSGLVNGLGDGMGKWKKDGGGGWPKGLRHGSVVGVTGKEAEGLRARWGA